MRNERIGSCLDSFILPVLFFRKKNSYEKRIENRIKEK